MKKRMERASFECEQFQVWQSQKTLLVASLWYSSYLCKQARLDLQRLATRGLRHYGNSILHPHRVTGMLGRGRLQPCAQIKHMYSICQQISKETLYKQRRAVCKKIRGHARDHVTCFLHTDLCAFNRCQNPSAVFEHSNSTWENKNSSHGNSMQTVSNNGFL